MFRPTPGYLSAGTTRQSDGPYPCLEDLSVNRLFSASLSSFHACVVRLCISCGVSCSRLKLGNNKWLSSGNLKVFCAGCSFLNIRFQSVTMLVKQLRVKLDFSENRIYRLGFCLLFCQHSNSSLVPRFQFSVFSWLVCGVKSTVVALRAELSVHYFRWTMIHFYFYHVHMERIIKMKLESYVENKSNTR